MEKGAERLIERRGGGAGEVGLTVSLCAAAKASQILVDLPAAA